MKVGNGVQYQPCFCAVNSDEENIGGNHHMCVPPAFTGDAGSYIPL